MRKGKNTREFETQPWRALRTRVLAASQRRAGGARGRTYRWDSEPGEGDAPRLRRRHRSKVRLSGFRCPPAAYHTACHTSYREGLLARHVETTSE